MIQGMKIQVAIDCADPHALVRFWAALLDYEIEQDPAFVQQMLDLGYATPDDTAVVDGVLTWRTAVACSDPSGRGPRLLFQQVPEPKTVKNRVHLDLHTDRAGGQDDRDTFVARALELGATKLWDGRQGPMSWVTLADPEGNELCIS